MKSSAVAQLVRFLRWFGGANSRFGESCQNAGTTGSHIGRTRNLPKLSKNRLGR
jgi:hypothetical protein